MAVGGSNDPQRLSAVITPIFLLSQPRSGSTLLQRILAVHPEIYTLNEPWLLLPLLSHGDHGIVRTHARYNELLAMEAWEDFSRHLPKGRTTIDEALARAVTSLYQVASPEGTRYFLDKTPRNLLVADKIARLLPEARFIILFRHPLAVASSIIRTWGRGRWVVPFYKDDIVTLPQMLVRIAGDLRDRSVVVRYEDLIENPMSEVTRIGEYLDIQTSASMVEKFSQAQLGGGRMGDPTGRDLPAITSPSSQRWESAFSNALRRRWARRYVHRYRETLNAMGYSEAIRWDVGATSRDLLTDVPLMLYGASSEWLPRAVTWRVNEFAVLFGRRLHARSPR